MVPPWPRPRPPLTRSRVGHSRCPRFGTLSPTRPRGRGGERARWPRWWRRRWRPRARPPTAALRSPRPDWNPPGPPARRPPAQPPEQGGARAARGGPDRARGRGPAPAGGRPLQPPDRRGTGGHPAHGGDPRRAHPAQARPYVPRSGGPMGRRVRDAGAGPGARGPAPTGGRHGQICVVSLTRSGEAWRYGCGAPARPPDATARRRRHDGRAHGRAPLGTPGVRTAARGEQDQPRVRRYPNGRHP